MNEIIITNTNGELTTSSLGVAKRFGKQHCHVLDTIENLIIEKPIIKNMFIEGVYKVAGNNKNYKYYELTRDGFSLLVMGFTGKKALEWKLKYIEAFNLMEQKLRQQNQADYSSLSPQLQFMIKTEQKQRELENAIETANRRIDNMCETMKVRGDNWRKDTKLLINRIVSATGEDYGDVYLDIYNEVEYRADCDLTIRLNNMIKRLRKLGVPEHKIDNLNRIDVIANDKKLTEIYIATVKEMAIKCNIWENERKY